MIELNKHTVRSQEIEEVMSEIPRSITKWSLSLFFSLVIIIVGLSWVISYPEVVTVPVTLTTYNSPTPLIAKVGGRIEMLFISNEVDVSENQNIAIISNQIKWEDIVILSRFIESLNDTLNWQNYIKTLSYPTGLFLGEIQNSWLRFVNISRQFREYINQSYLPLKLKSLEDQMKMQKEILNELKVQVSLSEQDLHLSMKSYDRDSTLFFKSTYSISLFELEKSKQALLQKQIAFSSLKSLLKNDESMILKMNESALDLGVQYTKEINQFETDLNEARQLVKVSIEQWKDKYLIISPINGKITFTTFWNKNQFINAGEILATIIPKDPKKIIVRARIPITGAGFVRKGQETNIRLSGFPYMQYGSIKGKISSVSLVPVNNAYISEIELINGMVSTYNKEISYINEMSGTADIIVGDKSLLFKIIRPLIDIIRK